MKTNGYLRCAVLCMVVLVVSCHHLEPYQAEMVGNARCEAVATKGFINILNINVLFDRSEDQKQRFKHIAEFAAANEVDVILLQEVVGGAFAGTQNSAQMLREILLEKYNLDYNLATAWEIGEPETWSSANAILSKCEITRSEVQQLPFVVNEKLFKKKKEEKAPVSLEKRISLTQNVQLANIEIPGRGRMNVFNTHLCARTDIDGRADQLEAMLAYIHQTEAAILAGNPSVIGGDFNFDLFDNQGAEKFLWQRVVSAGFIDAYADHAITRSAGQETLDSLCEDEDNADEHCTVGVSDLNGHNARRVDYVFARDPSRILDARVVFNPTVNEGQHSVSDHAGVFISLELN